eukprot:TRINITY_DN16530_c0_g1_i1.p1 TRINITY_DN16530_c0_g1~~TRINITY_DN16530_c0_g1_i1.p1  ORF type:complete len:574 (+),score=226.47 TRINITY_DN16530_c0_g1_i1:76-1722(+)
MPGHVLSDPVTEKDIEACGGFTEEFFTKLHARHGPVAKFTTMGQLNISFSDAKAIKQCHLKLPIRPDGLFPVLCYLGKENLLFRKNPVEIKQIRERYAKIIRAEETMNLMHDITVERFSQALDRWQGRSVDVHEELGAQIYDIMGRVMFGGEWSRTDVGPRIRQLHLYLIEHSNRWAYLPDEMKEKEPDYQQFKRNTQELRDICARVLDEKRRNLPPVRAPAARGLGATAEGLGATADGLAETARGLSAQAAELGTHAAGVNALATGLSKTAQGLAAAAEALKDTARSAHVSAGVPPPAANAPKVARMDAFTLLLQETNPDGTPFFDREFAISTMIGFLNGAYDTTHSTLHWTLFHLAKFPDVQERLRKEIFQTLGASHPFTLHDARKLEELQLFVQESQRHKATTPFNMRYNPDADVEIISGEERVLVPKGTTVTTPYFLAYKDEAIFGEGAADAMSFCPHRFQGEDPDMVLRNSYLTPFGGGPRMCLGFLLATVEMKAAIICVLRRCQLMLADPVSLPMDTLLEAGVLQPVKHFKIHFAKHPRACL